MGSGWLVGVAINLVGSILINLGTNVMKLGHIKRAALPEPLTGNKLPVRKIREWQVGVALFTVGNVANFISFGYAAQSLLAAIGCIQFVSNVFFASFVLKEKVSMGVIAAISCIVGGCVLLVSFGSHTSQKYTYQDLLALYGKPAYVSYLSVGAAVVVAAYAAYWVGQKNIITKGPQAAPVWVAVLPILYCLFSAIIGTQSVLFSKTLAVLLRATASGDNQLTKWFTWLVLPAFLFSAVFWVSRLNKGLKMFPAMIIVPTLQICWTLFSIISGMLYFQEYQDMHALHAAMFALGVSIVFVGVFLLTKASAAPGGQSTVPEGPLVAELTRAKIAYVRGDFADGTETGKARIGTEVADGAPGVSGRVVDEGLHHAEADTPCSQGSFLRGSPALHPQLNPSFDDYFEDDEAGDGNEEQEHQRSLLATGTGTAPASQAGAGSFSRVLTGFRLQQLWGGSSSSSSTSTSRDNRGSSTAEGGQGVQVLPDFAGGSMDGAADAAARHTQHQRQRLRFNMRSLPHHVVSDFSLDETAAARLSLGLGDSSMPGVSLFTMPMMDLNGGSPQVGVLASRSYGMLPDRSQGGTNEPQGFYDHHAEPETLSSKNNDPFSSSSSTFDSEGGLGASAAAVIRGLNNSSSRYQRGAAAEQEMVALGPNMGINPLANAIDLKSTAAPVHKAPFDGLMNSVEVAAKSIKHNILDIRSNIKDLTASMQGGGGGRNYARMQSADEMFPILESPEDSPEGGDELQ